MFNYLIIENDKEVVNALEKVFDEFNGFHCAGRSNDYQTSMDLILKHSPNLVFINIDNVIEDPFKFVHELNVYSVEPPLFIALSKTKDRAYEVIKNGFFDLLLCPVTSLEIRKSIMLFQKKNLKKHKPKLCIKSYKDFRYLKTDEILFLKADNNTTDFYMDDGTVISAYRTMKTFESVLPNNFIRVHKSYVLNKNHVSRIQFGKSTCTVNNDAHKIPFSKTYQENIELMQNRLSQFAFQPTLN